MQITLPITFPIEHEAKAADWIKNRGGIAVWVNHDLGSPRVGGQSFTPAKAEDGTPMGSPHWRNGNAPACIITDASQVQVKEWREVARVKVRRGPPCFGGIHRKDKDKLNAALEKAGDGASYVESFERMQCGSPWFECIIQVPSIVRPLNVNS